MLMSDLPRVERASRENPNPERPYFDSLGLFVPRLPVPSANPGPKGPKLNPNCFLAFNCVWEGRGPFPDCSGRLIRAHLIERQTLKREGLGDLVDDERTWVLACGGPMGNGGHHGFFDVPRTLRLARSAVPLATVQFAKEHHLEWYLDRRFQRRAVMGARPKRTMSE